MSFLGGFFSSLGSILPGFIEGERQAINDNWSDLKNYNVAQEGQLNNAFNEVTMPARINMMEDAAYGSYLNSLNSAMMYDLNAAYQPGRLAYGDAFSIYAPFIAPMINNAQMGQANWNQNFWQDPVKNARRLNPYLPAIMGTGAVMPRTPNM